MERWILPLLHLFYQHLTLFFVGFLDLTAFQHDQPSMYSLKQSSYFTSDFTGAVPSVPCHDLIEHLKKSGAAGPGAFHGLLGYSDHPF